MPAPVSERKARTLLSAGPAAPASYAVAAIAAVAGGVARLTLARASGDDLFFLLLTPVALLVGVMGGAGPALVGGGLGMASLLLVDAVQNRPSDAAGAALFLAVAAGAAVVGERVRADSRRAARDAARLREREAHLQSILDTVPDAMLVVDDKGSLQSFSSTAERLFGWPTPEVLGMNVSLLMPQPDQAAHDQYMRHYMTTGERRIIGIGRVVVGKRRDGSTFPMHLSVGEMVVGQRRYFTGFVRDLTEREQTQARMQELQSELAHLSRLTAMGEMASALAHELNQPLSAIANYLRGSRRLLERGDPADRERLSDALGKAADQAVRAGAVIQRLRQFVGRGETDKRVEDLPGLIEEASTLALIGARELGVRLTKSFDPRCETALIDRVQIQQVVVNLLRNAVDAMRESPRRDLEIIVAPAPGGFIGVTISDTGTGIGEETLARLFEPFMTTKKEGMGVGLSICRTIVEAHGGTIRAINTPSGGASFTFTLPSLTEAGQGE